MSMVLTKIRAFRKSKGYSQEDLAEQLGIEQKTYSNWERGRTEMTIDNLQRIADALGVDVKVFWDPDQFEKKDWKAEYSFSEQVLKTVQEAAMPYKTSNLNDKDAMIRALQEEVAYLRQVNKALATSLNQLNDKAEKK